MELITTSAYITNTSNLILQNIHCISINFVIINLHIQQPNSYVEKQHNRQTQITRSIKEAYIKQKQIQRNTLNKPNKNRMVGK
jgi:hypothetical protein